MRSDSLYDAGLLAAPYDERTFTDKPLSHPNAGPKRVLALVTLAQFANALRDPRAAEWVKAARAGIRTVPPSVFPETAREFWAGIDELPPAVGAF